MRRGLGASGISVSAIGLGCWGMSGSYGPADEEESVATLHHALDLGVDFIDTADSYGDDGHNESLMADPEGSPPGATPGLGSWPEEGDGLRPILALVESRIIYRPSAPQTIGDKDLRP